MLSRGLVIEAAGAPRRFAPLHPRMMLTNLFKIYEKEIVQTLRERRATVDRVVNMLIPVYEDRETIVVAERKA
jgi:sugar-specific transcriptional regulator TrmB